MKTTHVPLPWSSVLPPPHHSWDACGFSVPGGLVDCWWGWSSSLLVLGWAVMVRPCHCTDPCSCCLGTCVSPSHTILESILIESSCLFRVLEIAELLSELMSGIIIQPDWGRPSSVGSAESICTDLWAIFTAFKPKAHVLLLFVSLGCSPGPGQVSHAS